MAAAPKWQRVIPMVWDSDVGEYTPATSTAGSVVTLDPDTELSIDSLPLPEGAATNVGAPNLATGVVAIPTTAGGTQIVGARATRRCVALYNLGTEIVYFNGGAVTSANAQLPPLSVTITIATTAAINGLSASGTQNVQYIELYD